MRKVAILFLAAAGVPFACGSSTQNIPLVTAASASAVPSQSASETASANPSIPIETATHGHPRCGGAKLRVRFFDVAQGLSALVELPDGRRVLVDTGDVANRSGCGPTCQTAHQHLVQQLGSVLGGKPIDLLWITHQHSDHIGGAIDL